MAKRGATGVEGIVCIAEIRDTPWEMRLLLTDDCASVHFYFSVNQNASEAMTLKSCPHCPNHFLQKSNTSLLLQTPNNPTRYGIRTTINRPSRRNSHGTTTAARSKAQALRPARYDIPIYLMFQ